MFYQASCYEWSLLVALVLRDAETIQRLITRSHDHALETMAAVLKAIGKSTKHHKNYLIFFFREMGSLRITWI